MKQIPSLLSGFLFGLTLALSVPVAEARCQIVANGWTAASAGHTVKAVPHTAVAEAPALSAAILFEANRFPANFHITDIHLVLPAEQPDWAFGYATIWVRGSAVMKFALRPEAHGLHLAVGYALKGNSVQVVLDEAPAGAWSAVVYGYETRAVEPGGGLQVRGQFCAAPPATVHGEGLSTSSTVTLLPLLGSTGGARRGDTFVAREIILSGLEGTMAQAAMVRTARLRVDGELRATWTLGICREGRHTLGLGLPFALASQATAVTVELDAAPGRAWSVTVLGYLATGLHSHPDWETVEPNLKNMITGGGLGMGRPIGARRPMLQTPIETRILEAPAEADRVTLPILERDFVVTQVLFAGVLPEAVLVRLGESTVGRLALGEGAFLDLGFGLQVPRGIFGTILLGAAAAPAGSWSATVLGYRHQH